MKLKGNLILRNIGGEYVAVSMGGSPDSNMMIRLNETGAFLWKQLEQGAEQEEMVQALLHEYGIGYDEALADCQTFIEKLQKNCLLK